MNIVHLHNVQLHSYGYEIHDVPKLLLDRYFRLSIQHGLQIDYTLTRNYTTWTTDNTTWTTDYTTWTTDYTT